MDVRRQCQVIVIQEARIHGEDGKGMIHCAAIDHDFAGNGVLAEVVQVRKLQHLLLALLLDAKKSVLGSDIELWRFGANRRGQQQCYGHGARALAPRGRNVQCRGHDYRRELPGLANSFIMSVNCMNK